MSRATIIFYRNGEFFASIPTFQKVVVANGLSKEEFTSRLWREAEAGLRGGRYDSFAIVDRIDTITEVKNG
jgi:hypothetical protein